MGITLLCIIIDLKPSQNDSTEEKWKSIKDNIQDTANKILISYTPHDIKNNGIDGSMIIGQQEIRKHKTQYNIIKEKWNMKEKIK